jgi:hypothetical protein
MLWASGAQSQQANRAIYAGDDSLREGCFSAIMLASAASGDTPRMNRLTASMMASVIVASLAGCATVPQAADNGGRWVGAWATALYGQANAKGAFATDTTLRQIVHVSVGGSSIRIVLSNEFGTTDRLTICTRATLAT